MRKFLLAAALALATLLPQRAKASMPGCTAGGSPLYLQVPNAGATGSQWNACMQYDFNKLSTATIANSSTTGSSFSQLVVSTISGNPAGYIYITSNTYFTAPIAVNSSVTASAFFGNSASITDTLLVSNNIGVGAGATSPGSLVDAYNGTTPLTYTGVLKGIAGNFSGLMPVVGQANGDSAILNVASTDTAKAGYGGNIAFGGRYTNSNAYVPYAKIAGEKENSVNGHYGGNLVLYTKQSGQGSFSKQAVLDSSGTFNLLNALSATTVLQAAGGASFTGANGNAVAAGSMTASAFFGTTLTANSVTATTYGAVAAVSVTAGPAGTASLTSGSAALSTAYAATVQGGAGIGSNSPGGSVILNTGIGNGGTGQNGGVTVNLNRRDGSNLTGLQAGFVVTGGSTTFMGPLYVSSTTAGGAYILTDSSVTASAFFGNGAGLTAVTASGGTATDSTKLAKAGDTMTGALNLTNVAMTLAGANGNIVSGASVTASGFFGNALTASTLTINTNTLTTSGANVGIGLTGASAVLQVRPGTDDNLWVRKFNDVIGGYGTLGISLDSLNNAAAMVEGFGFRGTTIAFQTDGGQKAVILSNGNVGIGTASPAYKLQVDSGTIFLNGTGATVENYGRFLSSNASDTAGTYGYGFEGVGNYAATIHQTSNGDIAFDTYNNNAWAERGRINQAGTFAWGASATRSTMTTGGALTLASGAALTASGANGNIVSASSITTTGSLFGGDLVTNTVHPTNDFVLTAATNKSVYLRPNGTGTLQVDTGSGGYFYAGNWGFGTQTPASKLHMSSGTLTIDGTSAGIVSSGTITINPINNSGLVITESDSNNNAVTLSASASRGSIGLFSSNSQKVMIDALGTSYFNNSSNFGLGTANPISLLHMSSGAITLDGSIQQINFRGSANPLIQYYNGTGDTGVMSQYYSLVSSFTAIRDAQNGVDRFTVTQPGFVSIGAGSTPASKLSVSSGPITVDGNGSAFIGIGRYPGAQLDMAGSGATSGLRIGDYEVDGTGSESITVDRANGTFASPVLVSTSTRLLDITVRGYDGSSMRSAGGIRFQVDNNAANAGSGDMPGALLFLTSPDGSATPAERVRIDNAGKIGIGNINPATLLHMSSGTLTIDGGTAAIVSSGTWTHVGAVNVTGAFRSSTMAGDYGKYSGPGGSNTNTVTTSTKTFTLQTTVNQTGLCTIYENNNGQSAVFFYGVANFVSIISQTAGNKFSATPGAPNVTDITLVSSTAVLSILNNEPGTRQYSITCLTSGL